MDSRINERIRKIAIGIYVILNCLVLKKLTNKRQFRSKKKDKKVKAIRPIKKCDELFKQMVVNEFEKAFLNNKIQSLSIT